MWRAMGLPMAPRPIMPVRVTRSMTSATRPSSNGFNRFHLQLVAAHLGAPGQGCFLIEHPDAPIAAQHDAVIGERRFRRHVAFAHVLEDEGGIAVERIAEAAAARRVEA